MIQNIEKTLEAIKNLIELGDSEALAPMAKRLEKADGGAFLHIAQALKNDRLEDAKMLIEDFERQSRQLVAVFDPSVSALRVELFFQEKTLHERLAERDEAAKMIEHFQIKHQNHLGDAMTELLRLRMEKLRVQAERNPSLRDAYEAAKADFEDAQAALNSPVKGILYYLNEDDLRVLKSLYRRGSLICHPDRVAEDQKADAQEMFAELHEAYLQNDLKKLRLMVDLLEKTGRFEPMRDRLDSAAALRAQIELSMHQIEAASEEFEEIKNSSSYRQIIGWGETWEAYFERMRANFLAQIADLQTWHLLNNASQN